MRLGRDQRVKVLSRSSMLLENVERFVMEATDRGFRTVSLGTEKNISCRRLFLGINSPTHAPGSADGATAAVLAYPT